MIPRRLRLRNFLSYHECDLDLMGFHIAVLSGRNGDGKSALLDAMTWALWGEARGRVEDDRIRLGEQEMLVDFEFEVSGDAFQVVRKRTRGRGSGALDFFMLDPLGLKTSLTGGTISETQREINRRIRLDYQTFVNSAFVAQGRANEFTQKPPRERKEVFRKVLGLERYEELAQAANDRRRAVASDGQNLDRAVAADREEVAGLAGIEERLAELAAERAELVPRLTVIEAEVASLRLAALDHARREADHRAATTRLASARSAVEAAEKAIGSLQAELTRVRSLLEGADEVESSHQRLQWLRAKEATLAALQSDAARFEQVIAAAERDVDREHAQLTSQADGLRSEISLAGQLAAEVDRLTAEEDACRAERAAIEAAERAVDEARAEESLLRSTAAGAKGEADQHRLQAQELKDREDQLVGVATCPVCRQPLSPGDLDHVRQEYAAQRRSLGERYRDALDRAAAPEARAVEIASTSAELQRAVRTRQETLRLRERDLHSRLASAQAAQLSLPSKRSALATAEQFLADGMFAVEAGVRINDARTSLITLGYDSDKHELLRAQLRSLSDVEQTYREFMMARQRAEAIEASIDRETRALTEGVAETAAAEEAVDAATAALESAIDVAPRLHSAESDLSVIKARETELSRLEGRHESDLDRLREVAARIQAAADRLNALKDEEAVFSDLQRAFGRDGIQAMLIDQHIPLVENYANEMLDRMTGGRIHVRLETLRLNAAGRQQETLDIRISDDIGTRDYEMYSGGEAFRVDFALRIALARVLAARSGSDLPTLVIDEGFGSQDQEGIDRLVEALNAIAPEFRLILVVTHIEELRERFDRRIEVTKDPVRGSIARVV